MRPICLRGHTRPITKVAYNSDGDLVFSSSKDGVISVWYTINGERLGTYDMDRTAAVWSFDVDYDSRHIVSATAAPSLNLYDLETGRILHTTECDSSVRSSVFSFSGKQILYTTDRMMTYECQLIVMDARSPRGESVWKRSLDPEIAKLDCSLWGVLDQSVISAHHDGSMRQWDLRGTGEGMKSVVHDAKHHSGIITDLQMDNEMIFLITASKDRTARLIEMETLDEINVYKTEKPVNSASISPVKDHVILGGGQEASEVTTTTLKEGKFDAKLFHLMYANEFGLIKGHFGPVNSVRFHPEGTGFASGGEDGMVRLHKFDPDYMDRD